MNGGALPETDTRALFDAVVQRLFAVGLSLQAATAQLPPTAPLSRRLVGLVDELDETIIAIRRAVFEDRVFDHQPIEGRTDGNRALPDRSTGLDARPR